MLLQMMLGLVLQECLKPPTWRRRCTKESICNSTQICRLETNQMHSLVTKDLSATTSIIHHTRLMSLVKLLFWQLNQMAKYLRNELVAILYPTTVCSNKRLSFEKQAKFRQKSS